MPFELWHEIDRAVPLDVGDNVRRAHRLDGMPWVVLPWQHLGSGYLNPGRCFGVRRRRPHGGVAGNALLDLHCRPP